MNHYFNNKKVLITGASAGIGEAFARSLYKSGAQLFLVARREDKLKNLAQELKVSQNGVINICKADLTNRDDRDRVVNIIKAEDIDILINNAGKGSFGKLEELQYDTEEEMIELNITATLQLSHAIIPQLKRKKSGGIIVLSSIAGFQPLPYMSTYSATKAFDLSHGLSLHYELKDYGVRVLTVCPGPVATEFGGVARVPGTVAGGPRDSAVSVVEESLLAYIKGRPIVVPCLKAKFMSYGPRILPLRITTWITERILRKVLVASKIKD